MLFNLTILDNVFFRVSVYFFLACSVLGCSTFSCKIRKDYIFRTTLILINYMPEPKAQNSTK